MIAIQQILDQRQATHGNFSDNASISQEIKSVMQSAPNWNQMWPPQHEALEMIAHKIGRILAGDPHHEDHWNDIAEYATLAAQYLSKRHDKSITQISSA